MNLQHKEKIEKSFGNKVASYNRHAFLQKETACKLCSLLPNSKPSKILEIGCGTGFLTEELQKKYPKSEILGIDISREMVASCRQKFTGYQNIDFQISDGEFFKTTEKFDLIVSNLAVQWFEDPVQGLQNLAQYLNDNGISFFTTIGQDSFKEWKDVLNKLNFSNGIIESPSYRGIFIEDKKNITYRNALDFLRNFKKIGAHQPRADYVPLNAGELAKACKSFDTEHQGQITWHILYGALSSSGRAFNGWHDFL